MLYQVLKPAVVFATTQFFREILVTGRKPTTEGPLLVVANHPNVMLDGLLVIRTFPQELWFIAKSTIFRGSIVSNVLNRLHLLPIKRRVDFAEGELDNASSFAAVIEKLRSRNAVLIFPEGKSMAGRQILPVKTGAARIAFEAEKESGFTLGLRIQVVGITYSDFYRLQSSVTVHVAKSILVSKYREQFEKDPRAAVNALSEDIERQLRHSSAEVHTEHFEKLVGKISKLYQSKGVGIDDLNRIRTVAREVERVAPRYPKKAREIERRIDQYLRLSTALRLDGSQALNLEHSSVFLICLAPFIFVGVLIHFLPYLYIANVVHRRALHRSQLASYQIATAFFLFPLWYSLIGYGVTVASGSTTWGLVAGVSSGICGLLSKNFLHQLFLLGFSLFWPAKYSPVHILQQIRDDLIEELDGLRDEIAEDSSRG